MRTLLFGVWLAGIGGVATQAWAGCKIEETKDIDGNSIRRLYLFENGANGSVGITSGAALRLELPVWVKGQSDAPIVPGGVLKFRLADGTPLQLTSPDGVVPKANVWGSNILTTWPVLLPVTDEQLRAFASSPIEMMEVPLVGQALSIDATRSPWKYMSKNVQKAAACWTSQ